MQVSKTKKFFRRMVRQHELIWMSLPIVIYVFIFNYLPLSGWAMAFQYYKPNPMIKEHPWAGLHWFKYLFTHRIFLQDLRNTLAMSVINLVLGFVCAIFLALMINEIRTKSVKRVVQTISYLPHFLSWVIACSMIANFLESEGILNQIMMGLGIYDKPNIFLGNKDYFWWIIGWGNVWKSVGWNTIIYLAAITAIDPQLYECAELDGAGRFSRMWHVTLPGIKATILVLVIMNIGWILNAGFEPQYLLKNGQTLERAETIDIFVIDFAFSNLNFSLATAMGIFKTVVSIILIAGANLASKRFAQESLV